MSHVRTLPPQTSSVLPGTDKALAQKWVYITNIINALACFVIVVCYLFLSAIPKYNSAVWETAVEFPQNASVPAIAFLTLDGDATLDEVQFAPSGTGGNLVVVAYSPQGTVEFQNPETFRVERIPQTAAFPGLTEFSGMTASVANISAEGYEVGPALQTSILTAIGLSCE